MLQAATGCTPGGIKGGGEQWLAAIKEQIPALQQRNQQLGFNFTPGQRPQPDKDGHIATTMEWARKLSADDVKVLRGQAPYSEDRKSTRLNSSHRCISYAVFCLKKKKRR